MNERQLQFAREYAIDGNGARAAVAAGYSGTNARGHACRLLANDHVRAEIKRLKGELDDSRILSARDVLVNLSRLAETAEKEVDRIRALTLLARHHALLVDRVVLSEEDSPLKTLREVLAGD